MGRLSFDSNKILEISGRNIMIILATHVRAVASIVWDLLMLTHRNICAHMQSSVMALGNIPMQNHPNLVCYVGNGVYTLC